MKERVKELFRNEFLRNVSILASGTIISQLIVIASSPLLTRLYSVEAFGMLTLFTSYVTIFAVLSTGRYELAIALPKEDKDGINLVYLASFIGFCISLLYLFLILLARKFNFFPHKYDEIINSNYVFLFPIYIFFIALYSALSYWEQRFKNYKKVTFSNALQVITTVFFSVLFGFLKVEFGLIISLVLGIVASSTLLLFDFIKKASLVNRKAVKNIGKEYISFPKFMIISDLSTTLNQQIVPIIFSLLYNTSIVGLFSLSNRMLRLPNIIITSSITNVFRNDAIEEIRKSGDCSELYKSTLKKLIIISFPIYLLIFILSPFLFGYVFGKEWKEAGYFAQIISLFLFFEFISAPLNSLFYITHKQKMLMKIQFLNSITGCLLLYLGFYIFNNVYYSLFLFGLNSIIYSLFCLRKTFGYSHAKT